MEQQLTKVTYRSNLLSRRMAEALGAICSRFAMLEWNVDRTIWALTGKDRKQGRHLTQHLLNNRRVQRLRKEANDRFGETHASAIFYNQVADSLEQLCLQRNLYVHGIWRKGKAAGARRKQYVISYFKNPSGYSEETDIKKLRDFATLVARCKVALEHAARQHIGGELP